MSNLRFRTTGYVTFFVEPIGPFRPSNWRQTPAAYQVIECDAAAATLGEADAWKFLHNQSVIKAERISRWAIHVSLKDQTLRSHALAAGRTNLPIPRISKRNQPASSGTPSRPDEMVCDHT